MVLGDLPSILGILCGCSAPALTPVSRQRHHLGGWAEAEAGVRHPTLAGASVLALGAKGLMDLDILSPHYAHLSQESTGEPGSPFPKPLTCAGTEGAFL